MVNLNRCTLLWPIVAWINCKPVHSSVSYQWALYQKYDRHGHEAPSRYGPLGAKHT